MRAFVLGLVVLAGPAMGQTFGEPAYETKAGCMGQLTTIIRASGDYAETLATELDVVPPTGREFADAMIAAQRKIDEGRKELADAALKLCNSYD